jgi:tetratricopeptide (TPR) repeat protein
MTVKQTVGIFVVCAALVPAGARAQLNIFLPAACDLKPNPLVTSGIQSLSKAFSTKFADQRTKELKDAERALTQAVTSAPKQDKPDKSTAATWYYLGRYYLLTDDLLGADSAFAKAQAIEPKCGDDIDRYRRQAWVPVFNAGVQSWQANLTDSAIASFRRANQIYRAEPMGFIYIANLFTGAQQTDSAAKYFKLAATLTTDPKYARDRRDAFFNVARVYHAAKRYDDAVSAYREYLGAYPNDVQARASLAGLYQFASKPDSATALYGQIVEHADSASADELFGAAQAVLAAIPPSPDTAAMNDVCKAAARKRTPAMTAHQLAVRCHPAAADTMRKYRIVADPQYQLTVKMYEAGLAKNPYLRDALYNLAGISYLIGDTSKVLPLALRLYAVDPMNRLTLAKVAGGYQLIGKKDSVLYYLTLADSLSPDVTVSTFTTNEKGADLEGLLTNPRSKPAPPLSLTFEFLDPKGTVVVTQPQAVPALTAGANQPFKLKVDRPGITAWRYHRSP